METETDMQASGDANNNSIPITGDNYIAGTRQINQYLQEVTIERTTTVTYSVKNNTKAEELVGYITTLKIDQHVDTILQLKNEDNLSVFEITCYSKTERQTVEETIDCANIQFRGRPLEKYENRSLKDIKKIPFIKVMIFEAPRELSNMHILQKLQAYGKLQDQSIFMHQYKGVEIFNGIRSVNFTELYKPLPTTLYVRGNRIKIKHQGQDRTPICAICKQKGHFRKDCPRLQVPADANETQEESPWIPPERRLEGKSFEEQDKIWSENDNVQNAKSWSMQVEEEEEKMNQEHVDSPKDGDKEQRLQNEWARVTKGGRHTIKNGTCLSQDDEPRKPIRPSKPKRKDIIPTSNSFNNLTDNPDEEDEQERNKKKRKKDVYKIKPDENRYITSQEDTGEAGSETNSAEEDTSFFDANGEEEQAEAPDLYP